MSFVKAGDGSLMKGKQNVRTYTTNSDRHTWHNFNHL